jgi:outer membrane protein assembly factor BamB
MNTRCVFLIVVCSGCIPLPAMAADWPQWRGPNRDAKASGFQAPKSWPKELVQKWKITVGEGVATPALVADKLYIFSRQDGNEITRCLEADSGKEVWRDKYEATGVGRPAQDFSGPRSSPAVADGKVVTLGVHGKLSCLDAATGKIVWRKDDFKGATPRFAASCSPLLLDGVCIVQLGSESSGGIVAYELATGNEKWKWTADGSAYASPVLITLDGKKAVVAETAKNVVAVGIADGKLLWKTDFAVKGRGYNSASPVIEGATIIYTGSGRGTRAVKFEQKGDEITAKDLWNNADNSVMHNSPIIKEGHVFGLTEGDKLFCIDAENGKTDWTSSIGGKRGFGSIVDAGPVLMSLTPSAELIVFEPTAKEFKELAKYKVGSETYAYPVVAGNRVFVKDKDSVTLWLFE